MNIKITKECNLCHILKPLEDFSPDKRCSDEKQGRCRKCMTNLQKEYYRTKEGLLSKIYTQQYETSKRRNHPRQNYSRREFKEWCLHQEIYHNLYNTWVINNYAQEFLPSIDRKDDNIPYTLSNIQVTTWYLNREKLYTDKKEGKNNKQSQKITQYNLEGEFIKDFYSQRQAERETGVNQSSIQRCCSGKNGTAGGFIWRKV